MQFRLCAFLLDCFRSIHRQIPEQPKPVSSSARMGPLVRAARQLQVRMSQIVVCIPNSYTNELLQAEERSHVGTGRGEFLALITTRSRFVAGCHGICHRVQNRPALGLGELGLSIGLIML